MMPRLVHQFYAWLAGYFWLPCPICGEYFGGHEWRDPRAVLYDDGGGRGTGVCAKCIPEAQRRNKKANLPIFISVT